MSGAKILIAVEHRRALERAQTYSIKEPETLDGIETTILNGARHILAHANLKSVIVELGTVREQNAAVALMQ